MRAIKWIPHTGLLMLMAALFGALSSASAYAREVIPWAALDFPPFQIRDGEYSGSGSFDGLLNLLIKQLPEYEHDVITMTFARREEEIRQGQRLCTPGLFRTAEREKLLVFSLPALIHLDNRVVFLAARAERFSSGYEVDLESMLKRQDLIGGIINQRSFAPNIDPLLRQYANAPNVLVRSLKSFQMFELLGSGEIDYTILFPHEAAYLSRQLHSRQEIALRPIAGTPPYIFTHVACTKGPWGDAMIARIDRVLRAQRQTPEYRAFSERWYDEPDKALIRKYYPQLLAPVVQTK